MPEHQFVLKPVSGQGKVRSILRLAPLSYLDLRLP